MRTILMLTAAALATSAQAAAPAKSAPPAPETLMCKDGSFSTARNACRGRGGVFAATASKTMTAPAGGVSTTAVTTRLPSARPARTTAVTVNEADSRATTKVTQISTPGSSPLLVSTRGASTTAFCVDGTSLKVRSLSGACRGHGGLHSSQTTSAMRVPAGAEKSIAAKTGTAVAVATTANPQDAASATRVTQTTVYPEGSITAICKDGSQSISKSRLPCNGRGGVRSWR